MRGCSRFLLAIAVCFSHSPAFSGTVTLYTTTFLPPIAFDGESPDVFFLDLPDQMIQGLSRHTPKHTAGMKPKNVMKKILAVEGETFFAQLNEQINGLVSAWMHGIESLPAIVLDDHYVFYGIYSVSEARTRLLNTSSGEAR